MKGIPSILVLFLAIAAAWVAFTGIYTVNEREQALILRFGEPQNPVNVPGTNEAGLHFKLPAPFESVLRFDKRNLEFDLPEEEIQAADQERLVVDAFMRYRISDPLRFYQTMRNEAGARQRLRPIMDNALRAVIASIESQDVVSGQRASLMSRIQAQVTQQVAASDLGIEIIDVRIRRADLPQQIANQVYLRMESERRQAAEQIRAEGEQRSREIRADADRQATVIRAEARAQSERIRGEGDGRRNAIFAEAYGRDPEFFAFYRSMLAYEAAVNSGTTLVLAPDSDFFRYFGDQAGGGR